MSAAPILTSTIAYQIEIINGPHAGQKFSLKKNVITFGRGSENDIILSEDPKVSRQHAEVSFSDKNITVTNLSQKNYVVYRGQKVHTQALQFGEKIYIGDCEILFTPPDHQSFDQKTVVAIRSQPIAMQPQQFSAPVLPPPMPPPSRSGGMPPRVPQSKESSGRMKFYLILGGVILALYLFLTSGTRKKVDAIRFGPSETIQRELLQADVTKRNLLEEKRKNESLQARRARENFTKGFRDYMQGQYARAKETFQVVLTLDPNHIEGRRYLTLSKLKFDQQVKNSMQQGRINFENKNYRLCKSHFLNVMTMLNQQINDPTFQEAKKLYELCDLNQGNR